jgi:serine/threonine protein kinase
MADRVGQQLGKYRLTRLLGQGGSGDVYLGEHIYLGTQAAIKVLNTKVTGDDVEKFLTEARTVAHLKHFNIVRVLDSGIEDGAPYLVMDYAPKGTLRERHPKGYSVPLPDILSYVKQIAAALQYAHDQKLIHRDVKPGNMLVGANDEILLSDFGIAVVAHTTDSQSLQNIAGTASYMSPEQLVGKASPASDQYAFRSGRI